MKLGWQHAVEKAGRRKITANIVKNAVKELQPAGPAPTTPKPADQPTKSDKRQLINAAFGELLLLLSQKASHDILTQKVEKLPGCVQALLPKPNSKSRGSNQ